MTLQSIEITLEEAMTATDATVDLDWCNRNARGFMAIRVLRAEVTKLQNPMPESDAISTTVEEAMEADPNTIGFWRTMKGLYVILILRDEVTKLRKRVDSLLHQIEHEDEDHE